MKKRYVVRLSSVEREQLEALVKRGREAAYRRRHAQVLLLAEEGEHGNGWLLESKPINFINNSIVWD